MPVATDPNVIYACNEDRQKRVMVTQESDDNSFHSTSGQFRKKLYQIFEEKRTFSEILKNYFLNQDELKKSFLRLSFNYRKKF